MAWFGPINSGVAAGGAGVATNNATSTHRLTGLVTAIYVKYNDSPPAGTTDVTIKTVGSGAACPSYNLLAITNAATDGLFEVVKAAVDATNTAANWYLYMPIDDYINVTIAQANNGDSVDVWINLMEE